MSAWPPDCSELSQREKPELSIRFTLDGMTTLLASSADRSRHFLTVTPEVSTVSAPRRLHWEPWASASGAADRKAATASNEDKVPAGRTGKERPADGMGSG